MLLIDDETGTYWDHITGDAVHGPLKGSSLETWPLRYTTVEAELDAHPDAEVSPIAPTSLLARTFRQLNRHKLGKGQVLPPFFRSTMAKEDDRLPRMEVGLGVMHEGGARFYPLAAGAQEDHWQGRALEIRIGELDGVPEARWKDDQSKPMQLFTRWYGFALTCEGCVIVRG